MSVADITLVVCLVLSVVIGASLGTIKVVSGLGALVIAYKVARVFSATIATAVTAAMPQLVPSSGSGDLLRFLSIFIETTAVANRVVQIVAFIVLFIVVSWLVRKIAHLLSGLFRGTVLGVINSAIGALCAVCVFILLFNIVFTNILPVFAATPAVASTYAFLGEAKIVLPLLGDFNAMIVGGFQAV